MDKRLALPVIVSTALGLPLFSQTDFEYSLVRYKGSKIVLLGDWKAADNNKWKEVIDSDGVYEHGFTLLNREKFMDRGGINRIFGITDKSIDAFELWIRQKYGLSAGAKWLALNYENKLITAGADIPDAKEFDKLLEQRGIKSPLRMVREFLQENPDHLEARADLLGEVRRRALHKVPVGASEDLDTENDLRIWGVLAAETDRAFSGSWPGLDIRFFEPQKDQPEKFSNLMKNMFRKHISKIESAIISDPANSTLWNIWAWMARSSSDYNWSSFVNSLEPFDFTTHGTSPSSDVCVWIVDESREKKEWDTVIKYAWIARGFTHEVSSRDIKNEWAPGGGGSFRFSDPIENYPIKSAYVPHLEALLRLGIIDEANAVYDEMIRTIGKTGNNKFKTNNALIAADVARRVGMDDLAALWELGEQINKSPIYSPFGTELAFGLPYFYIFAKNESDFQKEFYALMPQLSTRLMNFNAQWRDDDKLGWKIAEGERWGLFSADGQLLAQDSNVPDKEVMRDILKRNGIISFMDFGRTYIAERGNTPGIELRLAYELISQNNMTRNISKDSAIPDDTRDQIAWGEAAKLLRGALGSPEILLSKFPFYRNMGATVQSQLMKSLSEPYLTNIESLLEIKPSSEQLWAHWYFWRAVEGGERPIEPLVERIKYSPLSPIETLPSDIMNTYYEECRKNGQWPKVIRLLETVWEREFSRKNEPQDQEDDLLKAIRGDSMTTLGDRVVIPLIEAYLNDNKTREAEDVFSAWLNTGGSFKDISKIVELAKIKDQERLAKEWEEKTKK